MYIETQTPIKLSLYSETDILKAFFQSAIKHQSAIAVWRMPNSNSIHLIVNISNNLIHSKTNVESVLPGFVISPFVNRKGDQTVYIPADLHYNNDDNKLNETSSIDENKKQLFIKTVLKYLEGKSLSKKYHFLSNQLPNGKDQKSQFIKIVKKGIRAIETGKFQKVVPARTMIVDLNAEFDLVETFNILSEKYPGAFISLFSTPEYGTWMGASPELMIHVDKHRIFRTVALAGTQPFDKRTNPSTATWAQKEIEEQALVSRFIINQFKKIRLREFIETGPRTVTAGKMIHLKTEFRVDMNAVNFPELGSVMLQLLHPTSAVCGMPKIPSMEFIQQNETFDRMLYCGYLGPVNIREETRLYVNLRCMQLSDQKAILYAGAGITYDSDPEKEWEETNLKCQTLLNVLPN